MTLEEQKAKAKSEYIKARDTWNETRTRENPYGDRTLWEQFCEAKRQCKLWGVII